MPRAQEAVQKMQEESRPRQTNGSLVAQPPDPPWARKTKGRVPLEVSLDRLIAQHPALWSQAQAGNRAAIESLIIKLAGRRLGAGWHYHRLSPRAEAHRLEWYMTAENLILKRLRESGVRIPLVEPSPLDMREEGGLQLRDSNAIDD